ncbi:hypothetical protein D3C78_1748200 [compost metagenome]
MALRVKVPVLSEQIMVALPRPSTAGSRRTSAFLRAMRVTPMANSTDTTIGNPSGMAATARLMPT